jgi:hypothetical protein
MHHFLKKDNLKIKKSHIFKLFLFSLLDYCLIQAVYGISNITLHAEVNVVALPLRGD